MKIYVLNRVLKLFLILVLTVILSGCSTFFREGGKFFIFDKFRSKSMAVYNEFCDVLIPGQLKIDDKKTNYLHSSGISAGVLSLKGRISAKDLVCFFKENMRSDNWQIESSLESKRSIIIFKKDSRTCVICVHGDRRVSYAEIWTLPNKGSFLYDEEMFPMVFPTK